MKAKTIGLALAFAGAFRSLPLRHGSKRMVSCAKPTEGKNYLLMANRVAFHSLRPSP
jgi:hypothetical protein